MAPDCTGVRGIGNTLESVFINPLARALFAIDLEGRAQVTVSGSLRKTS